MWSPRYLDGPAIPKDDHGESALLDEAVLISVVHHLTHIRNICAHHGRLWNKRFTVTMGPQFAGCPEARYEPRRRPTVYNSLAVMST